MEKFLKTVEQLAPLLSVYPIWAQVLFGVTIGLALASLGVFLVLFPAAKKSLDKEREEPTSSFVITAPQGGGFTTVQRLTILGFGADPRQDNSLSVKATHVATGRSETAQGKLVINSDGTWRFEHVQLRDAGAYDLVVDAIFGGRRWSETIRINYEPPAAGANANHVKQQHAEGSRDTTPAFPSKAGSFNVLIAPFEALEESRLRETRYGRAVEKRLVELREEHSLDFVVRYVDSEEPPVGFRQAAEIGRKHNAHLVIWGDYYEKVHSDATHATVKYSLVDLAPPNVAVSGKTPITEVQSLTLISQGYLQNDIDYILFWVLALDRFSSEKYAEALPLFEQVRNKFPDHFKGLVSFKMNGQGMSLSMNLPALHLLYNLAFCYSVTGRNGEAVPCWSAILHGGTKDSHGNMTAWDTFAIAISTGNKDAMRICAFALLNRAIGYQELGEPQSAQIDYERLMDAARQSEVVRTFYEPVEPFVREQLRALGTAGETR